MENIIRSLNTDAHTQQHEATLRRAELWQGGWWSPCVGGTLSRHPPGGYDDFHARDATGSNPTQTVWCAAVVTGVTLHSLANALRVFLRSRLYFNNNNSPPKIPSCLPACLCGIYSNLYNRPNTHPDPSPSVRRPACRAAPKKGCIILLLF